MRVALFSGNYNYLREGANQALNRLVRHLEEKLGHEVRVYSPVTATPDFAPAGTLIPVPSIRLPVRNEFRLALGLPRAVREDLRSFRPNLIHVSTPDILNTRAQTLGKRMGIPIVASLHTRFEAYLEHYRLGWARPMAEAHLKRFYRRSDHVLAPTQALVAELTRLLGAGRASLWSRGVDLSLFHPGRRDPAWRRSQGIGEDETILLFFGRLVLEKGVASFAATARWLHERGERIRPLIVGAGPAQGVLETLPGAVLTGHLEQEMLARAIASADILLHPSRTEAFGNVMLEAMASGLAIVGADATSARALIEDGQTGRLCAGDDPETYGRMIRELIAAPRQREALGRAAREASARYCWDEASQSVARTYERVLADHHNRPA